MGFIERIFGVGLGQGHGHIHVIHPHIERRIEDLLVIDRVDSIHNEIYTVLAGQIFNHFLLARVNLFNWESLVISQPGLDLSGTLQIEIRNNHFFNPGSLFGHQRDRFANPSRPNNQYFHISLLHLFYNLPEAS